MKISSALTLIILLTIASSVFTLSDNEKDYTDLVNKLNEDIKDNSSIFYHEAYKRLAYLSDTYGPRLWGSQPLEMGITELMSMAKKDGFDNVHLEPVSNFTKWIRGK